MSDLTNHYAKDFAENPTDYRKAATAAAFREGQESVVEFLKAADMHEALVDELELTYKNNGIPYEPSPRGWLALSVVDWVKLKEAVKNG